MQMFQSLGQLGLQVLFRPHPFHCLRLSNKRQIRQNTKIHLQRRQTSDQSATLSQAALVKQRVDQIKDNNKWARPFPPQVPPGGLGPQFPSKRLKYSTNFDENANQQLSAGNACNKNLKCSNRVKSNGKHIAQSVRSGKGTALNEKTRLATNVFLSLRTALFEIKRNPSGRQHK